MHESNATNNDLCNILGMRQLFQKISAMTREDYEGANQRDLVCETKGW
jgi:hypothetical protein